MLAWLPRVPTAHLGMANKAWWGLEAAALLYLHPELPSLSVVLRKPSPGAGLGQGVLSHGPGAGSQGKVLCCPQGLVAVPNTNNHTMGTMSRTQLVNSKC